MVALFALAGLGALLDFSPAVVWSVTLVIAVLAARFVPMYAVDVPDQYLIDLDRLAVTAWSARERRPGRRGRIVVPSSTVSEVAASAARTMTAAAGAIAVAAVLASSLLVTRVEPEVDRIGVRCLVFFAGAALVLTARSHRHTGPRVLLRLAGLTAWAIPGGPGADRDERAATRDAPRHRHRARPAAHPDRGRDRSGLALGVVVAPGRGGRGLLCGRGARQPGGLHRTLPNPVGILALMFRVAAAG